MIKLNSLLYESKKVIAYHGSKGNTKFNKPNKTGIWFAEDVNSEIIQYYSTRGKDKIILKAELDLKDNFDLTDFNTDSQLYYEDAEDFLLELSTDYVNKEKREEILEPFFGKTSPFDYEEITLSHILNAVIEHNFIPNNECDSISIYEHDDELTHCILNKSCILSLTKLNVK